MIDFPQEILLSKHTFQFSKLYSFNKWTLKSYLDDVVFAQALHGKTFTFSLNKHDLSECAPSKIRVDNLEGIKCES